MPLYEYRCPGGHATELIRPMGTESVACPSCGADAPRSHVHHFDVVGPTVDTRGMYRRFTEAKHEIGSGRGLYQQARARAAAIRRGGS